MDMVQDRILCLVRDMSSTIVMGIGSEVKDGEAGLVTSPGGFVVPRFDADADVKRYCMSDLGVVPQSSEKVGEIFFDNRGVVPNVLLHVFAVQYCRDRLPRDTARLNHVTWYPIDRLPTRKMPCWGSHAAKFLSGEGGTRLQYIRDDGGYALTNVNDLVPSNVPA